MKTKFFTKARWLILPVFAILCSTQMWGATATNNCGSNITTSYSDMESGKAIEWKAKTATSYTSPIRVYSGNEITFHCKAGAAKITQIQITASTEAYATAARNSTWAASGTGTCSASASASGTAVTVTVTGTATTVTCTATAQTRWSRVIVTYDVAVSETYTVSFVTGSGNPVQGDLEEDSPGAAIELPDITPSCSGDGWELYGWAESSCASSTTTAPTIVGQAGDLYVPESDITLYAVYRQLVSGPTTTTYTLNGSWTSDAGNWTKVDGSNLNGGLATGKWGLNSGSSSATSPIAYSDISSIVFTGSKSGSGSGTVEFLYGSGTTWTSLGSKAVANSQTWSVSPTKNGQLQIIFTRTAGNVYIASIAVTYKIYNYFSQPSCASCLENPTIGNAALSGTFNSSSIGVTCPTISAGTNCSINDYGFVWKAGSAPSSTSDGTKVQVGTNNQSSAFNGTLTGSFNTSTTYYVKAYATNNGDHTTLSSTALVINPRSITFYSNGGTSVAQIFVNSGTAATQPADPTKDGFGFEGWFTDNGTFASPVNWSATITSNQTYYAKWGAVHYTITYNAGENGSGSIANGSKTHDVAFTLSDETFTRTGYTQDGWSTSDGGGKAYELGGSYTTNAAITLYPYWVINNYTVSWSVNGSSWSSGVTDANNNADYGSTVSAPTAPTSSDCDNSKVFVGWTDDEYEDPAAAPTVLFTSTSPAITTNTTFHAVFATSSGGGATFDHYEKVTSAPADWTAYKYVIATADAGVVLTGYAADHYGAYTTMSTTTEMASYEITVTEVSSGIYKLYQDSKYLALNANENRLYFVNSYTGSDGTHNHCDWQFYNYSGGYIVESPLTYTINKVSGCYRAIQYNSNSGQERFACYKHNSQTNAFLYKRVEAGSATYSDYATSCCTQPSKLLTMTADKESLVQTGTVEFTLDGGNGKNITWSCVDEEDNDCTIALLTSTSNSGATLTISSPAATTKTYSVTATQPEDDSGSDVICGKTITIDIKVKKQWTITFQTTDNSSPIEYSTVTVTDGETYTFPDLSDDYTCETYYSFAGWKAANTPGAPEYMAGSSATASAHKTWYAVWMYSEGSTTISRDKYELVTDASTLAANQVFVVGYANGGVALAQMDDDDEYGSPVAVDFADNYLTFASGTNVMELKLQYQAVEDEDHYAGWYFVDNKNTDRGITYSGEGGSLLWYEDDYWTWDIAISAQNNATISDVEEGYTAFSLQYNSSKNKFAFYSSAQKKIQLYRKNGTISISIPSSPTYYVNNTNCTNGATIRATGGQWVTSAKDQKVRITVPVTAKNFGTSGKQIGASSDNAHFNIDVPSHTIPDDGTESATINIVVEYTPAEANVLEEANITLATTGSGDNATKVITVNGRSLPDEFVIVTQKESKWQALPADMFSGASTYAPIQVTPNNALTQIPAAPYSTIYTARAVATDRYATAGNCVRLVGNSNKCLWANHSPGNTNIQNWAILGSTNGEQYEWLLYTQDGEQYTIANPAHDDYATGRQLGIYSFKYGLYKTTDLFYLLPVGCSSQPGNVQITPRRVDAVFSWESNAASVTIELWKNETMTGAPNKTATVTSVPYQFTGLEEGQDYWYKLTPGSDTDCAITGKFSTTGPTIDLVEWGLNSATIYVDIDPTIAEDEDLSPQILIAGEHEHGQGGTLATNIFFSKYFEAEGTAKMLGVFNGTGSPISLADVTIVQRDNATAFSLATYGKTPGFIQPGEEILFYTRDSRSAVMKCAEEEESFDTWNDVGDKTGSANFNFGGKGTIRLFRGGKCIDIIGAMVDGQNIHSQSATTEEGTTSPSWAPVRDNEKGFVTATGDNYSTPYEETDYGLSTCRCLLIRKKTVTSGDSAVLNNFTTFKTLGVYTGVDSKSHKGEWAGLQVPDASGSEEEYIHTCEGFQEVGKFDYNKYYHTFDPIGDSYLSDFTRAADGTYTLPIDYMRQYACMNLRFQLTAHGDQEDVLTEQLVQVPIIVENRTRTTNDTLFNYIIRKDAAKPDNDPMIDESAERCKTCNVVILGTGTLTKVADGTTITAKDPVTNKNFTQQDVTELGDVKIYPGGKLIVPEGTHFVVNSLSLRRQEDVVSVAKIDAGLAEDPDDITDKGLYIRSNKGVYLDVRIDPSNWHYFTLPYNCRVGDIRFSDGTPAKVNTDYRISWYDGAYRAEHKNGGWTDITDDEFVLKKGLGYIVGLPGDGKVKRELRFPMENDVIDDELVNKVVNGLYAYGGDKSDEDLRPNHKGWNMIGNPYMYDYETDIITAPLAMGELVHDPSGSSWNGKWVRTGDARYIVAPIDNGWSGYEQTTISNMKPFMSYFIQVGTTTDGTDNPETDRSITFKLTSKASIVAHRVQAEEAEDTHPVWYGIELLAPNGEKDNTTLLMSNDFTDEYDMMNDLVKMRGDYYTYYNLPVLATRNNEGEMAFNALPDSSAAAIGVPVNYYAATAGTYKISTDFRYDLEEVKSATLFDASNNTYTDLLAQDYEFSTAKGNNTNRFTLYVRVERKKAPNIETDVDNILNGQLSLITIGKTLVLSGLATSADVYVYDMSGKLLTHDQAGNGIWRTTVPASGVYFVRVNGTEGQQTLQTIVY